MSTLIPLSERRQISFEKFANKTSKNPKYQHWCPKKENIRLTRSTGQDIEEIASGNRLYNSPIFTMRRLLNGNNTLDTVDMT